MKDPLVRFGVAMEKSLLTDFDRVVDARGSTRSEAFRDLARAEVSKAKTRTDAESVATLTLVYDHHVRDLTEKLMEMQHELGERVRSTMHIHLDHDHCLEVIVMMGRAGELRDAADRLLGTRGVSHGGIEIVALDEAAADALHHTHSHSHAHGTGHAHTHSHAGETHTHAPPAKVSSPPRRPKVASPTRRPRSK